MENVDVNIDDVILDNSSSKTEDFCEYLCRWRIFYIMFLFVVICSSMCLLLIRLNSYRSDYDSFVSQYFYQCADLDNNNIGNNNISKIESFYLERFHQQLLGEERFAGTLVPWRLGGPGFGNSLWGVSHVLLFTLITKSSPFIEQGIGYYDPINTPLFQFFSPRSIELCRFMQYPPPNNFFLKKMTYGKFNSIHVMLHFLFQKILGERAWWIFLLNQPFHIFYDSRILRDYDRTHDPSGCHDSVCFNYIISVSPKELPKEFDMYVLDDNESGWFAAKIWQSEKNTDLLCNQMKLCDGVDLDLVNKYRKHRIIFMNYGFRLIGNMFRRMFKINEKELSNEFDEVLEESRDNPNSTIISMNIRNHYIEDRVTKVQVIQCLENVMDDIHKSSKSRIKEFQVFIASDKPGTPSLLENIFLKRRKENLAKSINTGKNNITFGRVKFLYFKGGDPNQSGIRKDKDWANRVRLMKDFLMLMKADVHIVTEESTFGLFATLMSKSYENREIPYVLPSFKSEHNFERICTQEIPMQLCREKNCPLDYTKEYLMENYDLEKYSWAEERMREDF